MTAPVKAALATLLTEIDELRREVGLLKGRLNEAEDLADRDGLTPVLNRRAFVRELQRVITFAQRFDTPSSLVYFDLDGFKAVNDRFGHAAGDAVLVALVAALSARKRQSDMLFRTGGEEFVLLLPRTAAADALQVAEDLRLRIADTPLLPGHPITASIGVAVQQPRHSADDWLGAADRALYLAKHHGRNRVETAP